jgi:hypothetical protein
LLRAAVTAASGLVRSPEALGDRRGHRGGEVVHSHDRIERAHPAPLGHPGGGGVEVREVEGEQRVGGQVLQGVGALGRADKVHAERGGGVDEGLGPVRPGRQQ